MAWGENNSLMRQTDVYNNKSGAAKSGSGPASFNGSNKIVTLTELLDNYNITYTCEANGNICPSYSAITFNAVVAWRTGLILHLGANDHGTGNVGTTWQNQAATGTGYNFTLGGSWQFNTSDFGWVNNTLINNTRGDGGSSGQSGMCWAGSNFIHSASSGTIIFKWKNGTNYSGYLDNKFICGNLTVGVTNDAFGFRQRAYSSEIEIIYYKNGGTTLFMSSGAGVNSNSFSTVVFTYSGSTWTYYVNGVQRGTSSSMPEITTAASSFRWTLFSLESGRYSSSGSLKAVMAYNRVLTLTEMEYIRLNVINF